MGIDQHVALLNITATSGQGNIRTRGIDNLLHQVANHLVVGYNKRFDHEFIGFPKIAEFGEKVNRQLTVRNLKLETWNYSRT